jgi:hypothetical protein
MQLAKAYLLLHVNLVLQYQLWTPLSKLQLSYKNMDFIFHLIHVYLSISTLFNMSLL